jgi:hypothetical protein
VVGRSDRIGTAVPAPARPAVEHPAAALLDYLTEIHVQMFEQVQQALVMMTRMAGDTRAGRSAVVVEQELTRITELNAELARLQGEVTRLALAHAAAPAAGTADTAVHDVSAGLPPPDSRAPDVSDAIHDWVRERIGMLQRERQARWDKLLGLFPAE